VSKTPEERSTPTLPDLVRYEVTTSATTEDTRAGCALITELESYIRSYVTLAETSYALVIALWLAATHIWIAFDSFPYLVVTSTTKRSGKTRLLELLSFIASNSRLLANISPAALYRTVDAEKPTLLIDEAEMFTSAKGEYRGLLNTGYRRGQTVKRQDGDYETYCPKAFALIGDVHDTLRDRSIVVAMRRGAPARRFVYAAAEEEGASLREKLSAAISSKAPEIAEAVDGFEGLPFLTDRDEEIWTPLFILCRLLCPDRVADLTSAAADMSAAKTAKPRKHIELGEEEDKAQEQEYAIRLLRDMVAVTVDRDQITTQEAIAKLREIPTSPWRRFRGDGLKDGIEGGMVIARLLSPFGVKPKTLKIAVEGSTAKGYKRRALLEALNEIEQAGSARVLEADLATRVSGNHDAPEKLMEHAERPVERPFGGLAAQPSSRSGNGLDYRSMLVDLLDQVERLGPRLPVELHVKCKQYRSTIGLPANLGAKSNGEVKPELRAETKIPAAPVATVLRSVAENANLLAAAISTALTPSPVPETSQPEELPNEQNDDQTDPYLNTLANEDYEGQECELEPPTAAAKQDREAVSTTKVGDKTEPTPHGFYFEMRVHEKLPYVVRDANNPNLGILCECKNKADAEMKVATYEREAAEAMAAALDGADVPQVCKDYSEEEVSAMFAKGGK